MYLDYYNLPAVKPRPESLPKYNYQLGSLRKFCSLLVLILALILV